MRVLAWIQADGSTIVMIMADPGHEVLSNSFVRVSIDPTSSRLFLGMVDLEEEGLGRSVACWVYPASATAPAEVSAADACADVRGFYEAAPKVASNTIYSDGRVRQKDDDISEDPTYRTGQTIKAYSLEGQRGCVLYGSKRSFDDLTTTASFEGVIGYIEPTTFRGDVWVIDVGEHQVGEIGVDGHTSPSRRQLTPFTVDSGLGFKQQGLRMIYGGSNLGDVPQYQYHEYSNIGIQLLLTPQTGCRRSELPSASYLVSIASDEACADQQSGPTVPFQWLNLTITEVTSPGNVRLRDRTGFQASAHIPCMAVGVCGGFVGRRPKVGDTISKIKGLMVSDARQSGPRFILDYEKASEIDGWKGTALETTKACTALRDYLDEYGQIPPDATHAEMASCLDSCVDASTDSDLIIIVVASCLGTALLFTLMALIWQTKTLQTVVHSISVEKTGYARTTATSQA